MIITKLTNGIRVVMEQMPYLKTVSMGIWIHVGSQDELKENNGISHIIEHMLFKGTAEKSAKQLADIIAEIGDDVNAYTGKEFTAVYGTTISEYLPTMIDLFYDMLFHSKFDETELRKEKQIICDEIDMYQDSPDDLVHELIQKAVYPKDSLGLIISGTKSGVKKISRKQMITFLEKHYLPEKMVISLAGAFDQGQLLEQLVDTFGKSNTIMQADKLIKQKGTNKNCLPEEVAEQVKQEAEGMKRESPYFKIFQEKEKIPVYVPSFCVKHKEIEQLHINMAFPCITVCSAERFLFSVFNSMFGGSNNSRLFQQIREEMGLVYSIYSYGSLYERAGLLHIDITVNPISAERVLKETLTIIESFLDCAPKTRELAIHKAQIRTELIMGSESAKSRMNSNAKQICRYGQVHRLESELELLNQITEEDILHFSRKYLRKDKCSICLVGADESACFSKLRRLYKTEFIGEENVRY